MFQFDPMHPQITQGTCSTKLNIDKKIIFYCCTYIHLSYFRLIGNNIKYYSWVTTQLIQIGESLVWNSPINFLFRHSIFANWWISPRNSPNWRKASWYSPVGEKYDWRKGRLAMRYYPSQGYHGLTSISNKKKGEYFWNNSW